MHTQSERGEGELKEMKRKMGEKSPTRRYLQGSDVNHDWIKRRIKEDTIASHCIFLCVGFA